MPILTAAAFAITPQKTGHGIAYIMHLVCCATYHAPGLGTLLGVAHIMLMNWKLALDLLRFFIVCRLTKLLPSSPSIAALQKKTGCIVFSKTTFCSELGLNDTPLHWTKVFC